MEKELTFTEPSKGRLPISREKGKIHLLDHSIKRSYSVKAGETWLCEVLISEASQSIVKPIKIVHSKSYNSAAMESKMFDLKNKFNSE